MSGYAGRQSGQVITAFQAGNQRDAKFQQPSADPGKIVLLKEQRGKGIFGVRVKPGRNQKQLGLKVCDGWQNPLAYRSSETLAGSTRR